MKKILYMKPQDLAIVMAVLVTIFVSAILFGKCNRPDKITEQVAVVKEDPLVPLLKKQRQQDSITIVKLQEQLKQVQPKKEAAGKKATEAISRGHVAVQNNNCDSLKTAFKELAHQHTDYQDYAEEAMQVQGDIIAAKERVVVSQQSELELKEVQLKNIATNYSGLQSMYEKQSKSLANSERKRKRAKFLNRISVPVAIAGAAFFILSVH